MLYFCIRCGKKFRFQGCTRKLRCPYCGKATNLMTYAGYKAYLKNGGKSLK